MSLNNTINCNQHGFQDKCSCFSQLLECLNDWTDSYDKNIGTDIVNLDFAKAFDTIPHMRLIHKLKQVGIRGKMFHWMKNFFPNRKQRVILHIGS